MQASICVTVDPLSTHYRGTLCYNNQLIPNRTLGEEAFGATAF